MDIGKKIENIRNKPEHVRERYVWIAVSVCMLFILGIWLFSFRTLLDQKSNPESVMPVRELMDKSKESFGELPSMESIQRDAVVPTK